jgi:hypothetical protein
MKYTATAKRFWNRHNTPLSCQAEPNSSSAVPTAAMYSVRELSNLSGPYSTTVVDAVVQPCRLQLRTVLGSSVSNLSSPYSTTVVDAVIQPCRLQLRTVLGSSVSNLSGPYPTTVVDAVHVIFVYLYHYSQIQ